MSLTNDSVIHCFAEGLKKGAAKHLYIEEDVLYSYGPHFPLAVRYTRSPRVRFIINADQSTVTTRRHQTLAIGQLVPSVQIPFSALHSAIFPSRTVGDIEIVDVLQDTFEPFCRGCNKAANFQTQVHRDGTPICGPKSHYDGRIKSPIYTVHTLGGVLFRWDGFCFISGMDRNEPRLYFLSKLPKEFQPDTFEAALTLLAPEEVQQEKPENVMRQGDIFAVRTAVTPQLRSERAHWGRLLGTSHIATESWLCWPNVYVRGCLYHHPQESWRRPQHHRVKLGDGRTWYRVYKNRALESWQASGGVD